MDANFFRYASQELINKILGQRLEKIFSPLTNLWVFDFGKSGFLFWSCIPRSHFFCLSPYKIKNPDKPPAQIMRLRKYLQGQRVLSAETNWLERKLVLSFPSGNHLHCDFTHGILLGNNLEQSIEKISWPTNIDLFEPETWKKFPQLTPPLRKYLSKNPSLSTEIIEKLQKNDWTNFYVHKNPIELSLFSKNESDKVFSSALQASNYFGETIIPSLVSIENIKEQKQIEKKQTRRLNQLESDRVRLLEMVNQGKLGELIKMYLYQLAPNQKLNHIVLPDIMGNPTTIELNPKKTIQQNMQWFFERAAKGKRGLKFLIGRKLKLLSEQEADAKTKINTPSQILPPTYKNLPVKTFRSSDGFLIIRGKNQKANHQILSQIASPFDFWFHAAEVSGAHVILKRDSQHQIVPEQSLQEAAILAGLASNLKNSAKANILMALIKNVRKIKGAALGQVSIKELERNLFVEIDSKLEEKLFLR